MGWEERRRLIWYFATKALLQLFLSDKLRKLLLVGAIHHHQLLRSEFVHPPLDHAPAAPYHHARIQNTNFVASTPKICLNRTQEPPQGRYGHRGQRAVIEVHDNEKSFSTPRQHHPINSIGHHVVGRGGNLFDLSCGECLDCRNVDNDHRPVALIAPTDVAVARIEQ